MKIVAPITVGPSNLVNSNIAITETQWTPGTYSTGTQRYYGITLYEVIASPSTNDRPDIGAAATPPTWRVVDVLNRYRMFDFVIGQASTRASPISVEIDPGGIVNTVALFDVDEGAQSVRVRVVDPTDGTVYDTTKNLVDYTGITDWYAYFFDPYKFATQVVFTDLPAYLLANVLIDISGSGTVSVGEVVIGRSRSFGSTAIGTRLGIEDFSRKQRNEFGLVTIEERRFSRLASFDVLVENNQVNAVFNALASRRAAATLYIGGDAYDETYVLGFFRDFTILRTGPVTSELSIEIEGLV